MVQLSKSSDYNGLHNLSDLTHSIFNKTYGKLESALRHKIDVFSKMLNVKPSNESNNNETSTVFSLESILQAEEAANIEVMLWWKYATKKVNTISLRLFG